MSRFNNGDWFLTTIRWSGLKLVRTLRKPPGIVKEQVFVHLKIYLALNFSKYSVNCIICHCIFCNHTYVIHCLFWGHRLRKVTVHFFTTYLLWKFTFLTATEGSTLALILPRSRTGTVRFYTSTSNKRAARPKLYTKSLTRDLKRMCSRLTLVRISINL